MCMAIKSNVRLTKLLHQGLDQEYIIDYRTPDLVFPYFSAFYETDCWRYNIICDRILETYHLHTRAKQNNYKYFTKFEMRL